MVSTFQGWRFEDKPRFGQPKKFEDKELEALLEEKRVKRKRSLQNHWG